MLSDPMKRWLRVATTPFVAFAAVVFLSGWMTVSPFASWPFAVVLLLCAPSMAPFVMFVSDISQRSSWRSGRRGIRATPPTTFLPQDKFRWSSVLTPRRAIVVGVLAVVVFVSFFSAMAGYRGSPETVDGQLVFTDHGKVIGPATQRDADEANTLTIRLFTGHFLLFGAIGLLGRAPAEDATALRTRPRPLARSRRNRPLGSGRPRRSAPLPHSPGEMPPSA